MKVYLITPPMNLWMCMVVAKPLLNVSPEEQWPPLQEQRWEMPLHSAVQPAAIYGPGEERHLPRIISLAKLGLLPFKIRGDDVKSDWVYVENLLLALLLASMGLLDDFPGRKGYPIAAGQPYFIPDGSPVNSFEFICPLLGSLDCDLPKKTLAVPHALLLGNSSQLSMLLYILGSVKGGFLNL